MYKKAADFIKSQIRITPKIGIILGTGLGAAAAAVTADAVISYEEVPGMPISTVSGHAGQFVFGKLAGRSVAVMQGRIHFYEGYSMQQIAVPVHILRELGVETLLITNASGGINEHYSPGELVAICDHIKLDLDSPLRGENPEELGERFFDMSEAYSPKLRRLAKEAAQELGFSLSEGVYGYMGGPQFETPAEIRMLRLLGADLVGMSTVPEVIAAVHCGMQVLGLSCVTNMAAGMKQGGLNREVIAKAEKQGENRLRDILIQVVKKL